MRNQKMKLPRFIQKWIRKQFNNKKVCDKCLQPYEWQTIKGEMLCDKCFIRKDARGLTGIKFRVRIEHRVVINSTKSRKGSTINKRKEQCESLVYNLVLSLLLDTTPTILSKFVLQAETPIVSLTYHKKP